MLISLFIILSNVLGGSSEDPFILPKAEKVVKQAIEEPARKDQAALAMKSYSKEWKQLLKTRKKQAKAISKLNKDRSADPQAIALSTTGAVVFQSILPIGWRTSSGSVNDFEVGVTATTHE